MSDNGYTTLEDLLNANTKLQNDFEVYCDEAERRHGELKRDIAGVKLASETAHSEIKTVLGEIITRLDRLGNGGG